MTTELQAGAFGGERQSQEAKLTRRDLEAQPLSVEELDMAADYYAAAYEARATGPQLEGLQPENVVDALADPRTIAIERATPDGHVVWPLFVPVEYNSEYRPEFFEQHMGQGATERTYFYSEPRELAGDKKVDDIGLSELADTGAIIVFDYHETEADTTRKTLVELAERNRLQLSPEGEEKDEQDPSAHPKVIHFGGRAEPKAPTNAPAEYDLYKLFREKVARGEAEAHPERGVAILDPRDVAENRNGLADDIWEMYEKQFDKLIEDHPSMQKQPRESLLGMLADEKTITSAYFDEGKIAGMCFFVRNIESCDWLDADFYRNKYPNEEIIYFPGIVVDQDKEGQAFSLGMVREFSNLASEANAGFRIVFQCTNQSAKEVPRLVDIVINHSGNMQFRDLEQLGSYRYDVFSVKASTPGPRLEGEGSPSDSDATVTPAG